MEAKNLHCPHCGASLTVNADSAGQLQVTLQAAEASPSPVTPPPSRSNSRKALDRLAREHGELESLVAYQSRHVAEKERAAGRRMVQGLAFSPIALALALAALFTPGQVPQILLLAIVGLAALSAAAAVALLYRARMRRREARFLTERVRELTSRLAQLDVGMSTIDQRFAAAHRGTADAKTET